MGRAGLMRNRCGGTQKSLVAFPFSLFAIMPHTKLLLNQICLLLFQLV